MTCKQPLAIGLFVLAMGFNNLASAACEAEEEKAIAEHQKYNKTTLEQSRAVFRNPKAENEKFFRSLNAEIYKEYETRYIEIIRTRTDAPWMVASETFNLCTLRSIKSSLSSQSSGGVQLAERSQPAQQTQSTQQQSQQAQQQAQQAQEAARVAQTRADQARKEQRRRHEPENEASHCIQPDFGGLYGGMKNTCNFKVWYTYCGFRPKENSWLTGMSCEKQSFGSDSVSPGRTSASHTKGVEAIHWIACKEPAWALDAEFVPGQGIKGRCYTVGGK